MGGAVFVEMLAPRRILVIIGMSKAGAISLKVMGRTQA